MSTNVTDDSIDLEEYGKLCCKHAESTDGGQKQWDVVVAAYTQLSTIVEDLFRNTSALPPYEAFVFGGCVSFGIWDGAADIDVCCIPRSHQQLTLPIGTQEKNCMLLASCLQGIGLNKSNLETILRARVPIVKHHRAVRNKLPHASGPNRTSLQVGLKNKPTSREACIESMNPRQIPFASPPVWRTDVEVLLYFDTVENAIRFALNMTKGNAVQLKSMIPSKPLELKGVDFDISFRHYGLRNSMMLRRYLLQHPCARPGAIVLKNWAKLHGVSNSRLGYLTSYCIVILWVYYLVQKGVLRYFPTEDLPEIPREEYNLKNFYAPILTDDNRADDAFMRELYITLAKHIRGFFSFYTTEFDWENDVVTLNTNGKCSKESLGWAANQDAQMFWMAIQDPYEENLNLGRKINQTKFQRILQLMNAFHAESTPDLAFEKEKLSLIKASSIVYHALIEHVVKEGAPVAGKDASEFLSSAHYDAYVVIQDKYSLVTNFVRSVNVTSVGPSVHGALAAVNGFLKVIPRSVRGLPLAKEAKCSTCGSSGPLWNARQLEYDVGAYCDACWAKYEQN